MHLSKTFHLTIILSLPFGMCSGQLASLKTIPEIHPSSCQSRDCIIRVSLDISCAVAFYEHEQLFTHLMNIEYERWLEI